MQNTQTALSQDLTHGKLLAKNTVLNLFGQVAPLIAAVFCTPLLINGLGIDRFGLLTLAWVVIGYFSLFDFGIGRALTKAVADKLGSGHEEDIPSLAWTALFLMLMLGVVGAVVVGLLSPWMVYGVLNVPPVLKQDTLNAFYVLALSIPLVISTAGLRGILEAYQRFDLVNVIRIPMGLFTFAGPLLVLPFSNSLLMVVAVLVIGRFAAWGAHLVLCLAVTPGLRHQVVIKRETLKPLFFFGGWLTVTNVVGPLMMYLDRFLIGGFLSVAAVAYYTTPYEVVTKLLLIPMALTGVLFPAFATALFSDPDRAAYLFHKSIKYIFLVVFPITLVLVVFAQEGLVFWLGQNFAAHSARVAQWLAVGVFLNSLAQVPFALLQAGGRPDLTAKLHFVELPFYLLAVWGLMRVYGVEGAAIAWAGRAGLDAALLFVLSRRYWVRDSVRTSPMIMTLGVALFVLAVAIVPDDLMMKGLFLSFTLIAFFSTTWFWMLAPEKSATKL